MSTIEMRNKIIQMAKTLNGKDLERLFAYVESSAFKKAEVVAYTITGEAITREDYVARNDQAVASYKKGLYKTQSQILDKYRKKSAQ